MAGKELLFIYLDHINRDKLDKRRSNLRYVNSSVQMINRKIKGEIAGVHYSSTRKCWRNGVMEKGKMLKNFLCNKIWL